MMNVKNQAPSHSFIQNSSLIVFLNFNPVLAAASLFELGEADGEHAVFERGRGGVSMYGPAQRDGSRELAEAAL